MRHELEILEKVMFYDKEGITTRFPLYVYRMKENVDRRALETALGYAIKCHPAFGCLLCEDEKGPYLETNPESPIVPDLDPQTEYFYGNKSNNNYPWVVGIHKNEIIYTGYHGIADGIGATIFMRTVLFYYFKEIGIECENGNTATLESATEEFLERDTECSIRKNNGGKHQSHYTKSEQKPSLFPPEMLVDDDRECRIHNLSINLADVRRKLESYNVSQFAVIAGYVAKAISANLPGDDAVVEMNIVADMRSMLESCTTHNCVMNVPITLKKCELESMKEEELCKHLRSSLSLGFNREEVLVSCENYGKMEAMLGGNRETMAYVAKQIAQQFGFNNAVASVVYTHLTHTGITDDMFNALDDAYINISGFRTSGKQAIIALNAITTDKAINLLIVDGTKGEVIVNKLKELITESGVSFKDEELEKYKGIIYRK